MNQEIAISVKNKIAETEFSEVVSFNSVYRLKFTFDEEWEEYYSRVAVVMWAGGAAEKLFTGTECEMPQITSMDADTVLIGVYSRYGDKRIASSFVRLRCEPGAGGFPQPKPTLSLHEQILSFLNGWDWGPLDDILEEGIYSAVRVNKKGRVTEGMKIIEIGKERQSSPSKDLAPGGIFFRLSNGVYTPCYYDGASLQELSLVAGGSGGGIGSLGHSLTIGDQSFDGTADVTVQLGALAQKDRADAGDLPSDLIKAGKNISVKRDDAERFVVEADVVSSVNGMKGEVTLDQDALGLANVAYSGNFKDLVGAPTTGVHSVNGQTGNVTIDRNTLGLADVALTGSYNDLTDKPVIGSFDGVTSVNGQKGDVTLTGDMLGLAEVAVTGNYEDLIGAPENLVTSVNGKTGEVTLDQDTLGLANVAYSGNFKDLVGAPTTGVHSVNGQTGNVIIDRNTLGLADVALTGSYHDLVDSPEFGVLSVNGKTGEVTLDASTLGLGALAAKDKVARGDYGIASISTSDIAANSIIGTHLMNQSIMTSKLKDGAVTEEKIADGAVTGTKLAESVVKAGANISVTRDGTSNFVISTSLKTGVTSVNGKTGDVVLDRESLNLNDIMPYSAEAESGADCDTLLCGIYTVLGTTENPSSHTPVSLENANGRNCYWVLIAIPTADRTKCVQIAFSGRVDGSVRIRFLSEGEWSAWRSIYA